MAISTAFKQACPSCEALVPIKDAGMVGKKVDCPKCKYRFVVDSPAGNGDKATALKEDTKKTKTAKESEPKTADKTSEAIQEKPKIKMNGKTKEAITATAPANGKSAEPKAKAASKEPAESDTATSTEEAPKKVKKAGSKKLMLGLGVGGVGLVLLAVAAFLIMSKKAPAPGASRPPFMGAAGGGVQQPVNPDDPKNDADNNDKDKEKGKKKPDQPAVKVVAVERDPLAGAGPEFTNLLPNDTQHVMRVFFKNALAKGSSLRDLLFDSGTFSEVEVQRRLGFSPLDVDDLIRAVNFTAPWTFTLVHTTQPVEEKDLVGALDLEAQPPIAGQTYYLARRRPGWAEELGRLSLGAPEHLRFLRPAQKPRPLYVRLHDQQTIIFADEQPLATFLNAGSKIKPHAELKGQKQEPARPAPKAAPPKGKTPPGLKPGTPPGLPNRPSSAQVKTPVPPNAKAPAQGPQGNTPGGIRPPPGIQPAPGIQPPPGIRAPNALPGVAEQPNVALTTDLEGETYLTIHPILKNLLDRLETRPAGSKDKVFLTSASDMNAARIVTTDPDFQDRLLWQFRQLWDITNLIQDKKSRIHYLGIGLHQKENNAYRYKNEVICATTEQAKELEKDLADKGAPRMISFLEQVLGQKMELRTKMAEAEKQDTQFPMNPGFDGDRRPRGPFPGPGAFPPTGGMPGGAGFAPPKLGGNTFPKGAGFPPGAGSSPRGGGIPPPGGGFPQNGFPMPGIQPGVPATPETPPDDEDLKTSRVTVRADEHRVDLTLDLILDQKASGRLYDIAALYVLCWKNQLELTQPRAGRHVLGKAVRDLGVNGLSERGVGPGFFPPGAFKRQAADRSARDPGRRVSWMAALLPYLGQKELFNRIDFEKSWRDPDNWLAGQALVPEFLDPTYPLSSRRVIYPDMPFDMAATHYVGIAGVGLDAADYPANDPAFDLKRGVLSYDNPRGLKEVERGLSNAILLMQVPHDGPAGVTPWLAGGGSTLRGVPEKNSIAPFVLTTDKDGKPIQHNGKRGSFAVMADGSVRFINAGISDEVFKALCTVKAPPVDPAALNEWAPEVLGAKTGVKVNPRVAPTLPVKVPVKTAPPKQQKKAAASPASSITLALRQNQLKTIGLAYHNFVGAKKNPPANIEELAPFYENNAKVTQAVKDGDYVIVWNASFKSMAAGTSNTILGYEKDAPSAGGLVLLADGSVRTMTAAEFKKAPKASGK